MVFPRLPLNICFLALSRKWDSTGLEKFEIKADSSQFLLKGTDSEGKTQLLKITGEARSQQRDYQIVASPNLEPLAEEILELLPAKNKTKGGFRKNEK
jgi:hypothetical protein